MNQLVSNQPPFDRCGIAAASDLGTPMWREVFATMEDHQAAFLSQQHFFRSPTYKWPLDALHQWSRIWEYPYVYSHLAQWRRAYIGKTAPTVADIGSGVTFFPFSVARLGFHVLCADPDPVCKTDFTRAAKVVDYRPGQVDFRLIEDGGLPFETAECDLVYCISVLEHIQTFENTIREIARILKPDGLLYLTIDLDLQGNADIRVDRYTCLMARIHELFDLALPDKTIHPADMLSNLQGPYPMYSVSKWMKVRHFVKQELIKPLLGREPRPLLEYHLGVQGGVFTRRRLPSATADQ
jgi:SAM-dependent methyltransferase